MSSILDILTRAVSTSLVMANVFILAKISPSFGYCLLVAPLTPLSLFIFLDVIFSRTPTVS